MSINKHTKGRTGTGILMARSLSVASAASLQAVGLPGLTLQTIRVVLAATGASNAEVDSGVAIPAKSVILGCYIDMSTGASSVTPTIDVGTLSTASGGDADGFLAGSIIVNPGVVQGSMLASARTLGALQFVGTAASILFTQPAVIDIARNVSYTCRAVVSAMNGEIVLLIGKL